MIWRKLPAIALSVRQPLSQPSPCRIVSMVRCVVPEREGAAIDDVVEVGGLGEVLPLLRLGQLVRLDVARRST